VIVLILAAAMMAPILALGQVMAVVQEPMAALTEQRAAALMAILAVALMGFLVVLVTDRVVVEKAVAALAALAAKAEECSVVLAVERAKLRCTGVQ
jgi:hypothetical protein